MFTTTEFELLFVVHRCAGELLALRVGSDEGDRARFAIRGHDTFASSRNLAVLLVGERECVIVNFLVGSRIRIRVPGDGMVFAVILPRPLAMQRLTVPVGAIYGDFYAVASGLVHNGVEFR